VDALDLVKFVDDILDLVKQGGWDGKATTATDIRTGMRGDKAWRTPTSKRRWSYSERALQEVLHDLVKSGRLVRIEEGRTTRYRLP
jgi:hypothetical protein